MRLTPDTHLHSKEHVLADDLSQYLCEPKRFAAYLGIAKRYYEGDLRALLRRVLEKEDLPPKARGKYFFAALRGLTKITKKKATHPTRPGLVGYKRKSKRKNNARKDSANNKRAE